MRLFSIIVLPLIIAAIPVQVDVPTWEHVCTEQEIRAYEAKGWDAYECDGDKMAAEEEQEKGK